MLTVNGKIVGQSSSTRPPLEDIILCTCCICLVLSDYNFATFGLFFQNGVDSMARSMEKPRVLEDGNDKMKPWQLAEIVDPTHCRMVTMPDSADATNKVSY